MLYKQPLQQPTLPLSYFFGEYINRLTIFIHLFLTFIIFYFYK